MHVESGVILKVFEPNDGQVYEGSMRRREEEREGGRECRNKNGSWYNFEGGRGDKWRVTKDSCVCLSHQESS